MKLSSTTLLTLATALVASGAPLPPVPPADSNLVGIYLPEQGGTPQPPANSTDFSNLPEGRASSATEILQDITKNIVNDRLERVKEVTDSLLSRARHPLDKLISENPVLDNVINDELPYLFSRASTKYWKLLLDVVQPGQKLEVGDINIFVLGDGAVYLRVKDCETTFQIEIKRLPTVSENPQSLERALSSKFKRSTSRELKRQLRDVKSTIDTIKEHFSDRLSEINEDEPSLDTISVVKVVLSDELHEQLDKVTEVVKNTVSKAVVRFVFSGLPSSSPFTFCSALSLLNGPDGDVFVDDPISSQSFDDVYGLTADEEDQLEEEILEQFTAIVSNL